MNYSTLRDVNISGSKLIMLSEKVGDRIALE